MHMQMLRLTECFTGNINLLAWNTTPYNHNEDDYEDQIHSCSEWAISLQQEGLITKKHIICNWECQF